MSLFDIMNQLNRFDDADVNQVISVCGASEYVARNGSKREKIAQLVSWMNLEAGRVRTVEKAIEIVGTSSQLRPDTQRREGLHPESLRPDSLRSDSARRQSEAGTPSVSRPSKAPAGQSGAEISAAVPLPLRVFICYRRRDESVARELFTWLTDEGLAPWMDQEAILPGADWEREIRAAVRSADVFLVCLSSEIVRERTYVHKEIRTALDAALSMPEGQIFIIPLRLDRCDLPDSLSRWQAVDYFAGRDQALERLRRALALARDQKEG